MPADAKLRHRAEELSIVRRLAYKLMPRSNVAVTGCLSWMQAGRVLFYRRLSSGWYHDLSGQPV